MTSYLVKQNVTAPDSEGEVNAHFASNVLSDFELNDHIKDKIQEGHPWYKSLYEPLTDREAESYRIKSTSIEGARRLPSGELIDPPFEDYIGLHPNIIVERMDELDPSNVEKVRQYEACGLNRRIILDHISPSEQEPFPGFVDMGVSEILEKMDLLDDKSVSDIIYYEMHHQKRPLIIEFARENNLSSDGDEIITVKGDDESADQQ